MRTIDEIIQELKNHPDYITSEIITWEDYLSEINENFEDECFDYDQEETCEPITLDELNKEMKESILKNAIETINYGYDCGFNPYLQITRNHKTGIIEIMND
jgi:hypothetical protein